MKYIDLCVILDTYWVVDARAMVVLGCVGDNLQPRLFCFQGDVEGY